MRLLIYWGVSIDYRQKVMTRLTSLVWPAGKLETVRFSGLLMRTREIVTYTQLERECQMERGTPCRTRHYRLGHKVVSIYSTWHATFGNQLTSSTGAIAPVVITEASGNGESEATKENIFNPRC